MAKVLRGAIVYEMGIMETLYANNTLRAAVTLQACSDAAIIKAELWADNTQVGADSFAV